jgi:hypothetical protein
MKCANQFGDATLRKPPIESSTQSQRVTRLRNVITRPTIARPIQLNTTDSNMQLYR